MTSLCLNVTHAAQYVERRATMDRLRESLAPLSIPYNECTHVGPHWEWAELGWSWARRQDVSHALFLQDDVIPMPELVDVVLAMTQAQPESVIALHSPHMGASAHCVKSGLPWYTTSDNLIGTAYVIPKFLLEEFLDWRASALIDARVPNEDTQVSLWCMATGRRMLHPVPSPVDHDLTVSSTWDGGESEGTRIFRRPMLPWWKRAELSALGASPLPKFDRAKMVDPSFWRSPSPIPHVGRTRNGNHWMLVTHLREALPLRAYAIHSDLTTQAPK